MEVERFGFGSGWEEDPTDTDDDSFSSKGLTAGHEFIEIKNIYYLDGKFHATAASLGRIYNITATGIPKGSPEQFEAFLEDHAATMINITRVKGKPVNFEKNEGEKLLYKSKEKSPFKEWDLYDKQMKYATKLSETEDIEGKISNQFNEKDLLVAKLIELKNSENHEDHIGAIQHFHNIADIVKGVLPEKISDDENLQKIIKKARLYSEAEKLNGAVVKFMGSQSEGGSERSASFSPLVRDSSSERSAADESEIEGEFDSENSIQVNYEGLLDDAEGCVEEAENLIESNPERAMELYNDAEILINKLSKENLFVTDERISSIMEKIQKARANLTQD